MDSIRAPIRLLTRPASIQTQPAPAAEQEAPQQPAAEETQETKAQEKPSNEAQEPKETEPPPPQQSPTQQQQSQSQQQPQQSQPQQQSAQLVEAETSPEPEESETDGPELLSTTVSVNGTILSVEGVDAMVLDALTNGRDRVTVIKFDQQCCHFLKERRKPRLEFPNLSSYHRLLIHRIADYYLLAHNVEGGLVQPTVVLTRTEHSRPPAVRLCDLVEKEDELLPQPQQVTMIMKRTLQKTSPRLTAFTKGEANFPKEELLIQQRELEYEKARALIFDDRRSSPAELPNRKTVELLDQIMPSSRDPDAIDKKRMIEPGESHLYNRRLYAPTFPHYQAPMPPPHWYQEARLQRDCWQFPRPPMRQMLRDSADFMLDTSADAFPPLGKELGPECLLGEGVEAVTSSSSSSTTTTTLTAAAPSWSPPWSRFDHTPSPQTQHNMAFPSPLLTAEPEPKDVELVNDSDDSPQTSSPPGERTVFSLSASTSTSSSSSVTASSSCCCASSSSSSCSCSSSSAEVVLSTELVQLSLFSESQSFSSSEGSTPSSSATTNPSLIKTARPPRSQASSPAAATTAPTTAASSSTGTSAAASSTTPAATATAAGTATAAATSAAAAAVRAKKKPVGVARPPPSGSRTSPRANYPGGGPALLSAAPFQAFTPAPFASASAVGGGPPAPYYPSTTHRQQPQQQQQQPSSSSSASASASSSSSCASGSNRSSVSPSNAYYPANAYYPPGQPKPLPFPITAASWTSEMLPAKPRANAVGGKPQAGAPSTGAGPKKTTKVALKPSSEVTMHIAKPPSFAPRVQTEEDGSYQSFTPRRIQAGGGGQNMFPQAATFSAGQPYTQDGPYARASPSFNPPFNGNYGPHSPSQPYPANFTPHSGRFPQKSQSPSQQYGNNNTGSGGSGNGGNFAGQGGFAYPSPSHPYSPSFQQEGSYSSYPYSGQQHPSEYPSNFAYKQPRPHYHPSSTSSSSSSSSIPPANNNNNNNNNQEGYATTANNNNNSNSFEGGGGYEQQEQQQYQQQQQQYPAYDAAYPAYSPSGW